MNEETIERLTYAAKAAGYKVKYYPRLEQFGFIDPADGQFWNPLTSNDDAFNLMVDLRMKIEFDFVAVQNVYAQGETGLWSSSEVEDGGSIKDATRLAIVRSAEMTGRNMVS